MIPPDYITVWFSGSKGFHIEVRPEAFDIKPMYTLHSINKAIAKDLIKKCGVKTIDMGSIYSERRMWRLPFSVNTKTKLRKTRIPNIDKFQHIDEVLSYVHNHQDVEIELKAYQTHLLGIKKIPADPALKRWFGDYIDRHNELVSKALVRKPTFKYIKLKGKQPKCIEYLLHHSIGRVGDRNLATVILGSFFKEAGVDYETAFEVVVEWTHKIPPELTSIRGDGKIRSNIKTVLDTIYHQDRYSFQCHFIKPLISRRGFQCPSVCGLAD